MMNQEGKSEALVYDDVKTSKADEGWTEGNNMAGGDADHGNVRIAKYSSFVHVNEQIPYENPPKYCKRIAY